MEEFTERVVAIIAQIPRGKVLTYGIIAEMAGNRRAARQVTRILHSLSGKQKLPWHRVLNARGAISLAGTGYDLQKNLLESEGVSFKDGKIDLSVHLFRAGRTPHKRPSGK
jgi:methylated-DNA-protein-cysteine methyltransferase related protein